MKRILFAMMMVGVFGAMQACSMKGANSCGCSEECDMNSADCKGDCKAKGKQCPHKKKAKKAAAKKVDAAKPEAAPATK